MIDFVRRSAAFAVALATLSALVALPQSSQAAQQRHGQTVVHRLVIIRMDLDFKPHKRSTFGKILGYDPAEVHVHQNDRIQFVNPDDQNHTATGFAYT
ncbi:MAG: hypothetical protein GIW95_03435, partial [Candidatus Eremiobacteraeota bacterium]|nr:hypothetical protein [Candidatus Eremiobacteraeota bacterium]